MAAQSALTSASAYLEAEEHSSVRHEYFEGTVYAMSGGSGNHGEVNANLMFVLRRELRNTPCRNLAQDIKVAVGEGNAYFYPDALIACPPRFVDRRFGIIDNPTVLFEVLSPSTETMDRGPKFALYRSVGSLRDYVLVETESARVQVFSLEEGEWKVREYSGLGATASIPSVGVNLSLTELYEHVVFGDK